MRLYSYIVATAGAIAGSIIGAKIIKLLIAK